MKNIFKVIFVLLAFSSINNCTSDFSDINVKPDSFTSEEVSAKFFLTTPQYKLFAPDRYPYWRAHLIHTDRFAGHFCFGMTGSWWADDLGYTYDGAYTDAAWDWLAGYIGGLDSFMKMTKPGGELENEYMYAIGLIMRGLYFQMFTDVFGMIPYTEATNPDIVLPKFDEQKTIYAGLIAELDQAMQIIGSATRTGANVNDVGANDIYFNGDLQKWKKLANTLKLRMAMRAYGAADASFANTAISQSLAAPLLEADENCLMKKDNTIDQWASACYGDVWYNFGTGSDWTVGKTLIDYLRNNNDPRLAVYAKPAKGGTVTIDKPTGPEAANHDKRVNFLLSTLDAAGVQYTKTITADKAVITVPENVYYVGQPTRLNDKSKPYTPYEFFSTPAEWVIQKKNSGEIFPEIVMLSAEAYFLRADAAVRGLGSDNAQEMFSKGIEEAMKVWKVSSGDIATYLANAPLAQLTGTTDEKLEKIAIQRWISCYTDGFEAWAIVRDTGYPKELAQGVSDFDLFGAGDMNGKYPQRLRYGTGAVNTNGANVDKANATQGANLMDTKLWWAK